MDKRIVAVAVIAAAAAVLLLASPASMHDELSETFTIKGTFHESRGQVEIYYEDASQETKSAVLEVLGMGESFQRVYNASRFTETVRFEAVPEYGWKVNPITLVIEHGKYGTINAKTEIHSPGEQVPPVIFGIAR